MAKEKPLSKSLFKKFTNLNNDSPALQTLLRVAVGTVVVVLIFGASLVWTDRGNDKHSNLYELYTSNSLGLDIKHPKGWTARESGDNSRTNSVIFSKPSADDSEAEASAYLLVDVQETSDGNKLSAEAYFEQRRQEIEASLGRPEDAPAAAEYAEPNANEAIDVNGMPAYKFTIDIKNYNGVKGETGQGVLVFVFVNPSKQIGIFYEGSESDSNIYDSFDQVIASLEVAD